MTRHWILDGKTPKPVDDILEWARWYEKADRLVAHDTVGLVEVSTVFLGLDHRFISWKKDLPPLLFETMVFNAGHSVDCARYATWDEAVSGHIEILSRVMREQIASKEP